MLTYRINRVPVMTEYLTPGDYGGEGYLVHGFGGFSPWPRLQGQGRSRRAEGPWGKPANQEPGRRVHPAPLHPSPQGLLPTPHPALNSPMGESPEGHSTPDTIAFRTQGPRGPSGSEPHPALYQEVSARQG